MTSFLTPEVQKVALSLMEGLDCPRSLTVAILIRNREWVQLVNLECDPRSYCCAGDYARAVQATDLLRKLDSQIDGIDPEAATMTKWWEAEHQCFRTNERLGRLLEREALYGSDFTPSEAKLIQFVNEVRKNLLWLIGSGPSPVPDGAFGPGATLSDTSQRTTVLHKMSSSPTFTPRAVYHLVPWTGTKWAQACAARGESLVSVRGNVYFTVNKKATIKRACAKGPSVNVYYQLGLGREMRRRLKDRGIDLDDGQSVHRRKACTGSFSGELCTTDLSSASDTVSTSLVEMLVPRAWYNAMYDLREPFTEVNGRMVWLEKFSAMGNGYTFELETAIFTAILQTCMPLLHPGRDFWVYGDDLIYPTEFASVVLSALRFFGFIPNVDKTFVDGPFRESCGGDYFMGVPVRAYYIKELPYEPQDWIAIANGFRRAYETTGLLPGVLTAWRKCLDNIPAPIRRCRGPKDLGDLLLHDSEEYWQYRWREQKRYFRVYRPCVYRAVSLMRFDPDVLFAGALYGLYTYPRKPSSRWPEYQDHRKLILREGVTGYKLGWIPFS